MASERPPSKPTCLIVASSAAHGVSAPSFLHCFTLGSAAFNLQVATPGGKAIDFVDVNESNTRWIQDFRLKSYASPAKLESIDGARYHAVLIPNCPGAPVDLANNGYLARILQHFSAESKPICAVGHGVAALCCATKEDKSWVFGDYSMTGPSVYELIRQPGFASLPIIPEDFAKDAGATFSVPGSEDVPPAPRRAARAPEKRLAGPEAPLREAPRVVGDRRGSGGSAGTASLPPLPSGQRLSGGT
ncbi:glutamine amidotransferase-like class 1 domain-containing protein 1 isoform X2 [Tachyglossus aculeatus]|uniref:glutamine amidotransferase-like class 1 domain-containing protein 1 isoform X2 n=1 Tax=Tachyglossus aculeatus TaxID=9261 RepID=UPI0018F50B61|nr:glutamine amidotransferase-like class 1 domain-containing protein 1 isoform X2 [Tachyglossus aculeatus]